MDNLSKINRITVLVDFAEDEATINLYRTNQLLGSVRYEELLMISPSDSGLTSKAYIEYAKDVTINLINNGGLIGYYYEEKQSIDGVKYDLPQFRASSKEFIEKIINPIKVNMSCHDNNGEFEYYTNGFIKNAISDFGINIDEIELQVRCEIKSGQLCRPKTIVYNGEEGNFNITNIKHIMRG